MMKMLVLMLMVVVALVNLKGINRLSQPIIHIRATCPPPRRKSSSNAKMYPATHKAPSNEVIAKNKSCIVPFVRIRRRENIENLKSLKNRLQLFGRKIVGCGAI